MVWWTHYRRWYRGGEDSTREGEIGVMFTVNNNHDWYQRTWRFLKSLAQILRLNISFAGRNADKGHRPQHGQELNKTRFHQRDWAFARTRAGSWFIHENNISRLCHGKSITMYRALRMVDDMHGKGVGDTWGFELDLLLLFNNFFS